MTVKKHCAYMYYRFSSVYIILSLLLLWLTLKTSCNDRRNRKFSEPTATGAACSCRLRALRVYDRNDSHRRWREATVAVASSKGGTGWRRTERDEKRVTSADAPAVGNPRLWYHIVIAAGYLCVGTGRGKDVRVRGTGGHENSAVVHIYIVYVIIPCT